MSADLLSVAVLWGEGERFRPLGYHFPASALRFSEWFGMSPAALALRVTDRNGTTCIIRPRERQSQ